MVLFGIFLALVLLGLPVAFSFVVGGLFYQSFFTGVNPNLIASTTYGGIDSFSLLAIPFFIFAGISCLKAVSPNVWWTLQSCFLKILSVRLEPSVLLPVHSLERYPDRPQRQLRQSEA